MPTVSVVIATRNRAGLLQEAANSVLCQADMGLELLIVDDASTDETASVAGCLAKSDSRVRYARSQTQSGPGVAFNTGLALAKGEYAAIMGDDDVSLAWRLRTQVELLDKQSTIDLCFSSVAWFRNNHKVYAHFPEVICSGAFPTEPAEVFRLLYLHSNKIPATTMMGRRALFDRFRFPSWPWIGEDWFMCMQMAAQGVRMEALKEHLVLQRRDLQHPNLMGRRDNAHLAQRAVLAMTQSYLNWHGIREFDHLHKRAWANQLAREANDYSGIRGLSRCALCLAIDARSEVIWKTMWRIALRGASRMKRAI